MRIAVVSDIHGNLPALEAVLADLGKVRPEIVLYGGDLAFGGPHPNEVVDRIRDLGWPCVLGNTDEVLAEAPDLLQKRSAFLAPVAARTQEMLGPERVEWLTSRPMELRREGIALVHAVPGDCWAIVEHDAPDDQMRETYGPLDVPIAVYGHLHHAFVRPLGGLTVVNSGSLSLALDGDPRATYVVVEGDRIEHRRIPYDIEAVAADFVAMDYPHAATYVSWLRTGTFPT